MSNEFENKLYDKNLVIIHLDDRFLQGRIDTIANLTQKQSISIDDLVTLSSNFEKSELTNSNKTILEGMQGLIDLLKKIKNRISTYSLQFPNSNIFLLNFTNNSNSKKIFAPYEDKIIEIENSTSVIEKNLQQTRFLISKLFSMGLLPNIRLDLELTGVYHYACVNNINSHLKRIIQEGELPIIHSINLDLTL